jgi:hypothetical protein
MNIKEFKEYVAKIPAELDEYPLVIRDAEFLSPEDAEKASTELGVPNNGLLYSALDKAVAACFIDENTKQLCMLDEPSYIVLSTVLQAAHVATQPSAEVVEEEGDGIDQAPESAE